MSCLPVQHFWGRVEPSPSPSCKMVAMARFTGNLITVGDRVQQNVVPLVRCITSKMSSSSPCQPLDFAFQLPPPSPPSLPVGGERGGLLVPCATVEVYNSKTSQWYTADPPPAPRGAMTSITIADTYYLVGDVTLMQRLLPPYYMLLFPHSESHLTYSPVS